jgi:hypothetical protein
VNLPEAIWTRLKVWAGGQASLDILPSIDDCRKHVEFVALGVTGRKDSLPPEVVTFYASETLAMIEELLAELARRAE